LVVYFFGDEGRLANLYQAQEPARLLAEKFLSRYSTAHENPQFYDTSQFLGAVGRTAAVSGAR
jgi:hypothetical protein